MHCSEVLIWESRCHLETSSVIPRVLWAALQCQPKDPWPASER